jgi:hypothetical protein
MERRAHLLFEKVDELWGKYVCAIHRLDDKIRQFDNPYVRILRLPKNSTKLCTERKKSLLKGSKGRSRGEVDNIPNNRCVNPRSGEQIRPGLQSR